jgi:hypothetical protein
MSEADLYKIIQHIDKQLSKLNVYGNWLQSTAIPLLELRNNILTEFNPTSKELDWSIKEPQTLRILNRLNYAAKYE